MKNLGGLSISLISFLHSSSLGLSGVNRTCIMVRPTIFYVILKFIFLPFIIHFSKDELKFLGHSTNVLYAYNTYKIWGNNKFIFWKIWLSKTYNDYIFVLPC